MLSDAVLSLLIVSVCGLIALAMKLCYFSKYKLVRLCPPKIIRELNTNRRISIENKNEIEPSVSPVSPVRI